MLINAIYFKLYVFRRIMSLYLWVNIILFAIVLFCFVFCYCLITYLEENCFKGFSWSKSDIWKKDCSSLNLEWVPSRRFPPGWCVSKLWCLSLGFLSFWSRGLNPEKGIQDLRNLVLWSDLCFWQGPFQNAMHYWRFLFVIKAINAVFK